MLRHSRLATSGRGLPLLFAAALAMLALTGHSTRAAATPVVTVVR